MIFKNNYTQKVEDPGDISLLEIVSYCDNLFQLNCSQNGVDFRDIPFGMRTFNIMCNGERLHEQIRDSFREFITDCDEDIFSAFIPGSGEYNYVRECALNYGSHPCIYFQCDLRYNKRKNKIEPKDKTGLYVSEIKTITLKDIEMCADATFNLYCDSNGLQRGSVPYNERVFYIECSEDMHENVCSIFQQVWDKQFEWIKKILSSKVGDMLSKDNYVVTSVYIENVGEFTIMEKRLNIPRSLKITCDIKHEEHGI